MQPTLKGLMFLCILLAGACMSFQNSAPDVEFTATTYNVHYMERGIPGIIRTLKTLDTDVVAMQEVLSSDLGPTSATVAAALGYHHASSSPYVNRGDVQWVLAILSRHPIVSRDEILLGNSRRALRVVVRIGNENVEFITMHLTPLGGYSGGIVEVKRRGALRRSEISDLLDWLGPPVRPRILLGDFNMLRGTMGVYDLDEYELVVDSVYSDADGGWFPTNSDTFPIPEATRIKAAERLPSWLVPRSITLDYIFVTDDIDVVNTGVLKVDASDHWPLSGRFRIRR